jgi:SAM-dependent methyltransferase
MTLSNEQLSAQLYDDVVHDWPGEIDFYRQLIREKKSRSILEVACGTGRILLRVAEDDIEATGIDLSKEMLDVARAKSAGRPNITLQIASMVSFELNRKFDLAIVPGHSFQFMLTPDDQVACLQSIKHHLVPGGTLVVHLDHQDIDWLGDLYRDLGGVFNVETEVPHPETGNKIRISRAWVYDRATQTASVITRMQELDVDGKVIRQEDGEPLHQHCVFRFEMKHLLCRTGFTIQNVYGDFFRRELGNDSSEMIWVATLAESNHIQ